MQEKVGSNTANVLGGLGTDERFTRTDPSGMRGLLTDRLGSTIALTDSTGAVKTQYTYDPFGETTRSGNSNGNTYKFAGRELDAVGMYSMRNRYYIPALERFISKDPAGTPDGFNPYTYVDNSPTNGTDPDGLMFDFLMPNNSVGHNGEIGYQWSFSDGSELTVLAGINFSLDIPVGETGFASSSFSLPQLGPYIGFGGLTEVSDISQPPRFPLGPQWTQKGPAGNLVGPNKESIHPDFRHDLPKGWHYDWHMKNPKQKLSLRQYGEELQVWLGEEGPWIALEVALDLLLIL